MSAVAYDSRADTLAHIDEVARTLRDCAGNLYDRASQHDESKLSDPEKETFDRVTPRLRELTYGSDEYKAALADMSEALAHHYEANDHHPEHFEEGIRGMHLLQVVEMLCDWMAACKRHADGDIRKSIDQNAQRFGFSVELARLLHNTVDFLESRR